jgi:tRNA U34 2-thiouridine synthase MnmA/TrmU
MTIRAVGLLSGGLDSTLAAKLILDQGIEVFAVNFTSPFCTCTPKSAGCASVVTAVQQLGNIPLKRIGLGQDYLDMVRAPKFGYGRGLNPCIDCRILKIKKAAEYMREIEAQFLFTGEVLGQRPMSQHRSALERISQETGVGELILRPLSAQMLDPTLPEINGWVDREKLLAYTGRTRKPQIALAEEKGIVDYPCPAGGCLLTEELFALKLREYFKHTPSPVLSDMALVRTGRHFYSQQGTWVILARDEHEGIRMEQMTRPDLTMLLPTNFSAPVIAFKGNDRAYVFSKMNEYTHKTIQDDAVLLIRSNGTEEKVGKDAWQEWIKSANLQLISD